MKIAKITRLTGSSKAKFPQIGWLGTRTDIASIEKSERAKVLAAAGIDPDMELEDMQQAGMDVSVFVAVSERTLTARAATDAQVAQWLADAPAAGAVDMRQGAGEVGHVFANPADVAAQTPTPQMLIVCDPYTQQVVTDAYSTKSELKQKCETLTLEALNADDALRTARIASAKAELLKEEADVEFDVALAKLKAKKSKAVTAELTGAPAGVTL